MWKNDKKITIVKEKSKEIETEWKIREVEMKV